MVTVDLAILIANTENARDALRIEGERLQDQGRLLFSQCAGTMVEILKHIEQHERTIVEFSEYIETQNRNIKFLYNQWENIKHGKENK